MILQIQVQASFAAIECDQIQNGIVDLVNQNGIRKLIVGSAPDKYVFILTELLKFSQFALITLTFNFVCSRA
jgi:hypothetical protein